MLGIINNHSMYAVMNDHPGGGCTMPDPTFI